MQTFGQLLHVEDVRHDNAHYRMAVFRVTGGLHGRWACDSCTVENDENRVHATLSECIEAMKNTICEHHIAHHNKP